MSEKTKMINKFFKAAIKTEVDDVFNQLLLTERQMRIFELKYVRKKSIIQVADLVHASTDAVNKELEVIREQIIKVISKNIKDTE